MTRTRTKRLMRVCLSRFLCAALIFSHIAVPVYAVDSMTSAGGLCEHHAEHNDACGYKVNGGEAGREGPLGGTVTEEAEPCGYVCDVCAGEPVKDSGAASGTTPAPEEPEAVEPEGAVPSQIEVRCGWGNRSAASDYNADDVAAFQAILAAHPSLKQVSGVDVDDPASWNLLVGWDKDTAPYRITALTIPSKGLTGKLDVTGLTGLTRLYCGGNQLTELTGLGNLTKLTGLDCSVNQLTELTGLGNLTKLTELNCSVNQLTELTGLGSLTELTGLYCGSNQLTALDVSDLTKLTTLGCSNNPCTSFKTKDGHTLTVTPAADGKAWMSDYSIDNNTAELTAAPDSGYFFNEWAGLPDGATSSGNTASLTLSGDVTVAASAITLTMLRRSRRSLPRIPR